ncbi:hypothetical protein [Nocardia terpenica]|uniref:Uncharacterized protein n=1 Tax=Nocardia terpenica TaxID=455432 RepID=A0A291RCQ0_9NOCA|nr:hypothetical protein [Nocardia terpenica]ATL65371.1 hypothetical protein CRH09_03215 [Nocardia terpenica]
MKFAIAALVPLVVLALAAHRIKSDSRNLLGESTGIRNPFTQILLVLGLAKLCRVPYVTDDILSPALQRLTGTANLMTLAGLTFGALSAIPVLAFSSYITGRNLSTRIQFGAVIVITIAMIATYVRTPMAHKATPYLQNHFAVTASVLAFWVAFIAPLTVSTVASFVYTIREVVWVRRGPFVRALAGVAAANFLGFSYCFFNVMTLAVKYRSEDSFFLRNSELIENSLGLASLAAAGFAAGTYAWYILTDRIHRYRLLRRHGGTWMEARSASPDVVLDKNYQFSPTRSACWKASRSAEASYRLQIELADHKHQAVKIAPTGQGSP